MRIISAAEALLVEEGYGVASTRRVAQRAGLKPSLVHYYFPTTDDLYLALFEHGAAQSDAMIDAALHSKDPLLALWQFYTDSSRTAITLEFMALANHRPAIRKQISQHSEAMRERQVQLIERAVPADVLARHGLTADSMIVLLAGMGRILIMENNYGVSSGHDAARQWVEQLLAQCATGADCMAQSLA